MIGQNFITQNSCIVDRIFIIDNCPVFREGLLAIIHRIDKLEVCGETSHSTQVIDRIKTLHPTLIVMDLTLPNCNGLKLIKTIRRFDKHVKILVASAHNEMLFAERSIVAGANGYINKDESSAKILSAMKTVISGKTYLSTKVKDYLVNRQLQYKSNDQKMPEEHLSNRGLEVFSMIGAGLSTAKIANTLNLSRKTIDTHKEHIKRKLGIDDSAALVQRAIAWGFTESIV